MRCRCCSGDRHRSAQVEMLIHFFPFRGRLKANDRTATKMLTEQEKVSVASTKIRIGTGRDIESSIYQVVWSFIGPHSSWTAVADLLVLLLRHSLSVG